MRKLLSCAALGLVLIGSCAASRPYTVDDLVGLEVFSGVSVDPTEHWLLIDTLKPLDQAGRYDYLQGSGPARGRPLLVDLTKPAAAVPLLPDIQGMGYTIGPFSPDGARIAVYRHKDELWELGVVTLANRQIRWLGLSTDIPLWGSGLQWRSATELVALGLAPGDLPAKIRRGRQAMERLKSNWATALEGEAASYTRIGSGRYAGVRDLPPPKALLRIAVDTGNIEAVAKGQFKDLEISPSGRFVALVEAEIPTQPDAATPPRMIDFEGRRPTVAIFELSSGRAIRPTLQEILPTLLSWSQDDRLLVFTRDQGHVWADGDLREVNARTGVIRPLTNTQLRADVAMPVRELGYSVVQAGWYGKAPIILARRAGDQRPDWFELAPSQAINLTRAIPTAPTAAAAASVEGLLVQAGAEVWRILPGRPKRLGKEARLTFTPRTDGGARAPLINLTTSAAWIRTGKQDRQVIRRLGDHVDQAVMPAAPGERPLLLTRHGSISSTTNDHGVRTISITRANHIVPLLTLNAGLSDIELPNRQPLKHKAPNGRELTSWLYTPPGLKPNERAPLIVKTYPNLDQPEPPGGGLPSSSFSMFSTSLLTAAGYAVLDASYQRNPASVEPSDGFTQALVDATDAAIATGHVDPNRMALMGHSFGAYATMIAVARTHRFKAAIANMGISDLTSHMLTALPHYRSVPEDGMPAAVPYSWGETGQGNLGAAPWDAPQRYIRNSPVYGAGAVETPLLLVGADQEWGSIGQMEEMFYALWRQNKDAKLLTFWGETHGLESPANIRAYWSEVFSFLTPLIGPTASSGGDSLASRSSHDRTQASMASKP
ncbi:prolyl oligopeptidase family serine peptidase [Caulobacter sp. RHG1]|uniref:alpha/beta hydrolase family protein n=1 Tax=Caulobacter sp. (strain RHG1) TaxID=2545762 RepID=UPI0015537018|nr:hypothetical protein [Caulobacter sp. RHG1]